MTPGARKLTVFLAALCALAALFRYAPIYNDPLDGSLASWNAMYTARYIQCWYNAGFLELRGAPHLYVSPTDPLLRDPYLHHPPLDPWLQWLGTQALGLNEAGLRSVPILFAALAGALIVLAGARAGGVRTAIAAGIFYLTIPMSVFYGWMPNPESATLFFMLLTWLLHEKFRQAPAPKYAIVIFTFILGAMFDWQGTFIAPAIWLREWWQPAANRRLGRALGMIPAGALVGGIVFLLFSWWLGSPGAAWTMVSSTAASSAGAEGRDLSFAWLSNQARAWATLFTIPLSLTALAAGGIFLFRAVRDRNPQARALICLAVPGICNIIIFRKHAFDHEFWWYYFIPFIVIAPAWLFSEFIKNKIALGVAIVLSGCIGVYNCYERRTTWKSDTAPRLAADWNRMAGAGDGLLLPFELAQEGFYLKAWAFRPMLSIQDLRDAAGQAKAGRLKVKRLICLIPEKIVMPDGSVIDAVGKIQFKDAIQEMQQIARDQPATVRRLSGAQFASEFPTLASIYQKPDVYILTIGR